MVVNVAKVDVTSKNSQKEFPFIAKPFRSSELSFRVGGPIDNFEVYPGNYYNRGGVIAEIDPRDFRIRKERAQAVYDQAKAEFERIQVLYDKNNVSASSYEKAKAEYIASKTALDVAVNELDDTKLTAPFNGYVSEVYMEKYQDVKATQPVLSLIDIDQLKIEVYVTQDIAFNARTLKTINLELDALPGKIYEAKIVEVSKSTTQNNLSYLLTALLPNVEGQLLSGMSGKVFFNLTPETEQTLVTIPQSALCHRPTVGDHVWVVSPDGVVNIRKVMVGELLPNGKVSIAAGLDANETIAMSGLRFLSDGMTVDIAGTQIHAAL